ncbi:MAG TPA: sulfatase [Thermoanaerobaculia bacterium]|nr:sulfatase [Thermoanaerobaculia bacterium]
MRDLSRLTFPFPTVALAAALLLVLAGCGGERPGGAGGHGLSGAGRGWNVLLLSVDTLRADHLGAYGYPVRQVSPRMDALLDSGVRFAQAMSQRAATWPSLASVLTGLYPTAHGVTENGYGFPDDLPTLPKLLHGAGYRTAAFLSNMCQANHQGWDDFACSAGQDGKTVGRALAWAAAPAPGQAAGKTAGKKAPFFLWVHLFGAHSPYYNGGDAAQKLLDPGYTGELGPKRWRLDSVMTERKVLNARDLQHLNALYDAAVLGSDNHLGTLLAGLKAAGRLERTLVVFLSDHGEELYGHNGYLYHSCSVYQSALHVPLGISAPGLLPAGAVVPQTVELIDVAPTLLDLAGVAPPREQHGRSLVPYLERPGQGGAGKPAYSEYGAAPVHTVLEGGWKLVDNPQGFDPICIPNAPPHHFPIGREELYDLAHDPGETRNLAAAQPARVADLKQRLSRRFAGMANRLHHENVPAELRKQLEALGYAEH